MMHDDAGDDVDVHIDVDEGEEVDDEEEDDDGGGDGAIGSRMGRNMLQRACNTQLQQELATFAAARAARSH
jgi:hypothetical protein